jgi:cysteine-rich repeat protein
VPISIQNVQAVVDPAGDITGVWGVFYRSPIIGYRTQLRAASYSGGQWTQPQILEELGPGNAYGAKISPLGDRGAIVLWNQMCDPNYSSKPPGQAIICVYYTIRTNEGNWSSPLILSSTEGQNILNRGLLSYLGPAPDRTVRAVTTTGSKFTVYEYRNQEWQSAIHFDENSYTGEGTVSHIIGQQSGFVSNSQGDFFASWPQSIYKRPMVHGYVVRGQYFNRQLFYNQSLPIVCGDGVKTEGEQCDYRDNSPGSGCDSQCRLEDEQASLTSSYTMPSRFSRIVQGQLTGYDPASHYAVSYRQMTLPKTEIV